MPVCPDCRSGGISYAGPSCEACGWQLEREDGVPVLLSTADRESRILSEYAGLYERIAADDLENPIQGDEMLEIEADRLLYELGPLSGLTVCEVGVGRGILFERM